MKDQNQSVDDLTRPKASVRDVFFHFLSMSTLYVSTISFIVVLFQLINRLVPDPLAYRNYYSESSSRSLASGGLAFLIVMFPVFIYSLRELHRSYTIDPKKALLTVRRGLIYFTLFVSLFIFLFTCAFVIKDLFNGDLTLRFFLRFASLALVSVGIFIYYRYDLKYFDRLAGLSENR